jgi:formyltetrahydrofolate synthetase
MYPYVIRHEEEFLAASFGEAYRAYVAKTPRFFPDPRLLKEPESYTVDVKKFRKSIGDALWFIWGLGLLAVIHGLHASGAVRPLLKLP